MIVVKPRFFRHVSQRSLQQELEQGQEHRKEREYQVRQPDRSLLPVDEVLQDAAETDAAKLDTRSDAAGPKNNPRSPRTAITDYRINACFLPIQDRSTSRDTRRSRCTKADAITVANNTGTDSKKYLCTGYRSLLLVSTIWAI
jgi:hypothetical protein